MTAKMITPWLRRLVVRFVDVWCRWAALTTQGAARPGGWLIGGVMDTVCAW